MKIVFHDNYLCERGTSKSIFDYAFYNQQLLNNESIICYNESLPGNDQDVIDMFKKHFKLVTYNTNDRALKSKEIDNICIKNNIDIFYAQKSGENDGVYSTNVKSIAHCVFNMSSPHADVYSSISEYLTLKNKNNFSFVNYIVADKCKQNNKNLRSLLGIPKNAFVLGRHGGFETFSIDFVKESISEIIDKRQDLYFVFLNTKKFIDHPRVIFLDKIIDENEKNKFINTCDAMIHARIEGETFGLACAEFSIKNKPVITWNSNNLPGYYDQAHIHLLKDKGIYYENKNDLNQILLNTKREDFHNKNWNAYEESCSPSAVMQKFKNLYID